LIVLPLNRQNRDVASDLLDYDVKIKNDHFKKLP